MFINHCNKIKKEVEDTIYSFFKMTPENSKLELTRLNVYYQNNFNINFDTVSFNDVIPEMKDDLCKYKTLKYFNSIYDKLSELEEILKSGEEYDRTAIQRN